MKGQTEIKSAQHLKRWYSFRIFRIVWDRLVLDPSWLKSIPIPLKNWGWLRFRFQQSIAMRNRFRLRFRLTWKDWFRLRTFGSGINSVLIPYGGVHDTSTPKKTSKIWINVASGNRHSCKIARSCKNHIGGRAFWGKTGHFGTLRAGIGHAVAESIPIPTLDQRNWFLFRFRGEVINRA